MNNIRILVGLNDTESDKVLLQYTRLIADFTQADAIYFIHVAKDLNLPDEIKEKYPDLLAPVDETLHHGFKDKINKYFGDYSPKKINIEIKEGNPEKVILHWAKVKDIDLLMIGRRKNPERPSTLAAKLTRLCHCSLLMVPPEADLQIKNIYMALDFSEISKLALQKAYYLKEQSGAELVVHHLYDVPVGYYKIGKTYEEFSGIMKQHAIDAMEELRKELKLNSDFRFEATTQGKSYIAHEIDNFARAANADLIVIGSKGRTAAATLLLGSVAEKTIQTIDDHPILVIKNRGENMDLINVLLNM